MSLHGDIRVNGRVIGRWGAVRTRPLGERANRYRWTYNTDGMEAHGVLDHREADGATNLAAKVLARAMAAGVS